MTKIDIVSGFLGAGKTTLIKKMVKEAYQGEKLVLIENEFGEISIDGGFLKDAGIQISEMSSGCICCSLVGDFGKALREVKEQFQPDRILIEPSGVGKLSDVIVAVENTVADIPDMKLNSFVTVAAAGKGKVYMKNRRHSDHPLGPAGRQDRSGRRGKGVSGRRAAGEDAGRARGRGG